MTTIMDRLVVFTAGLSVVLLLAAALGTAFSNPTWLHLYTPALALPVLTQALATGLHWGTTDPLHSLIQERQ